MSKTDEKTTNQKYNTQKMDLVPPEELFITGIDYAVGDTSAEHYDERIHLPIVPEMVKNIMVRGVTDPVHVVSEGGRRIVISGRQRVRHAREANKLLAREGSPTIKVKTIIVHGDKKASFGLNLTSNEMRRNDGVMEKANKIKQALDIGMSWGEIALYMGLSEYRIKNIFKLLTLPEGTKKKIAQGVISPAAALEMVKLTEEEQKRIIEDAERLAAEEPDDTEEEESVDTTPAPKKTPKKKKGVISASDVRRDVRKEAKMKTPGVIKDKLAFLEENHGNSHAISTLRWVLGLED